MSVVDLLCFSHLSLHVSDAERSMKFYTEILGLEKLFDIDLSGEGLDAITQSEGSAGRMVGCLVPGGTMIELVEGVRDSSETEQADETFIFSLSVRDLDAAHRDLEKAGIASVQPPQEIAGVRMFFIEDPDRHRVELVEFPGGLTRTSELYGYGSQ